MMHLPRTAVKITLNPYQGLKPHRQNHRRTRSGVKITLNPYQGLKHLLLLDFLLSLG